MLKSTDIKELQQKLAELYDEKNIDKLFTDKPKVEILKLDRDELIVINNVLSFWITEDRYVPCLTLLLDPNLPFHVKSVTVDKGAIPFVANGADIMRPGIREIDSSIQKGDIIKVQEELHGRTLAVAIALFDAQSMQKMKKGKVLKSIHAIGDEIWEFSKTFK